ncbi:carbohydrate ABC transporter permease [Nocardioides sp. CPCC 206347]|uniref:carbohydrate ABC transporter permease n=1 Tax=unclassified Nocardioides TaxID=2615069 RepID=UPI00361BA7ED
MASTARRSPLPYGLVVPATIALGLALGYPLVRQVVLSLQEFGLAQQFGQAPVWAGFANYRELLTDGELWAVVLRTVAFCFVNAGLTFAIGLGLALLMTRMSRFVRVVTQCGLMLAWAMPVVAAMTVWQFLFDTDYGVVNWLLTKAGGDFHRHGWLLDPWSFFLVATIIVVWMSVPFVAFTLYAALTQVPEDVVEAAQIDGAGVWQRFVHVVFPSIRPVLLVVVLLQVIWDLRVFTQIYTLQRAGGIAKDTNLLGTYIHTLGIKGGDFGMAAAAAMFMLVLTVVLTAPYVRLMLKAEDES